MKTFPLTKSQKQLFAEKITDWGNLTFVGAAIIEVFQGLPLTFVRLSIGFTGLIAAYVIAYWLTQGGDK